MIIKKVSFDLQFIHNGKKKKQRVSQTIDSISHAIRLKMHGGDWQEAAYREYIDCSKIEQPFASNFFTQEF